MGGSDRELAGGPPRRPGGHAITVAVRGRVLSVGPIPPALGRLRAGRVRIGGKAAAGGTALLLEKINVPLYKVTTENGKKVALLPAGLAGVVRRLLDRERVPFAFVREAGPDHVVVPEVLPAADFPDPLLVETVAESRELLVRRDPRRVSDPVLVAQLVNAFPTLKVVVAAVTNEACSQLVDRLRQLGLDPAAGKTLPGATDPPPQLSVATYSKLDIGGVRVRDIDVLVAPDAVQALGTVPTRVIEEAARARLVGLLDAGAAVSVPDRIGLGAMFGSTRLTIPRHGATARTVRVRMEAFMNILPIPKNADWIVVKNAGVWGHRERNRVVARAARDHAAGGARVVVLVENGDHARALGRLLPGWAVAGGADGVAAPGRVAAGIDCGGAANKKGAGGAMCNGGNIPDNVIIVAAAFPIIDLSAVGVVVRADAGLGLPPGLTESALTATAPRPPLVLVDLADKHHPELRRAAARRRAAYAGAGWPVNADDPAAADLDFILAAGGHR